MAIKIFVDQGHNPGGINGGAVGNGLLEDEINYMVGRYLGDLLERDSRFEVRLSRNSPDEILGTSVATSLATRVRMANEWPADYFISIHCNANVNPNYNGTEAYVYSTEGEPYVMGEYIVDEIVRRLGTKNNGVLINTSLYVLRRTDMPAVLVELAYITNSEDAEKLETRQYDFAYAIYSALLEYFGLEPLRG